MSMKLEKTVKTPQSGGLRQAIEQVVAQQVAAIQFGQK